VSDSPTTESIAFDRAVEYYDRTRALPAETMAELTAIYATMLDGCGAVLEPGIGTGRFALPLRAAGVNVVGVDLAPAMLAQLRVNAANSAPPPVAIADATRLPFPDRTFGGAYVVHVLHLIPNWPAVVRELFRVVRAGGVFIDQGGAPTDDVGIHRAFQEAVGIERRHVGLEEAESLYALLDDLGASPRDIQHVVIRREWRPASILHNLAENRYSWTWRLDDETRKRGVEAATAWAQEHLGDIDAPRMGEVTLAIRAFRLP